MDTVQAQDSRKRQNCRTLPIDLKECRRTPGSELTVQDPIFYCELGPARCFSRTTP